MNGEQIGLWAGFVFTLMVFSYILGDNFLYRIAIYVFVGLAAGYLTIVTVEGVLLPWVRGTLLSSTAGVGGLVIGIIPFILGLLLLLKTSPRLGRLGNLAIAFIIGVGTAVALVGAVSGTLIPLAQSTGSSVRIDVLNGFLIFIGVSSTLVYFQYLARRRPDGRVQRGLLVRAVGGLGQVFIIITLGAVYAGAILTSLTIFTERISYILARITGG
ncbi:MAG: hypothetical protein K8L97_13420 [Anaerolineae bacterium]|nr:hypothetical protein [Anaerolineae bacterium]